jgi:citrate synthase
MAQEAVKKNTGLRGVKVADTKISFIDGEKGVLLYSGYRIEDLAEHSTFEETAYLLLNGELPEEPELANFKGRLCSYSSVPDYLVNSMKLWPKDTVPMQALMAAISLMAFDDKDREVNTTESFQDSAARLISSMAVSMTAWERIRSGQEPVPYSGDLSHAEKSCT